MRVLTIITIITNIIIVKTPLVYVRRYTKLLWQKEIQQNQQTDRLRNITYHPRILMNAAFIDTATIVLK